ncbi:DUF4139 domain-containing protein [uncultured Rhodospira sp.]|uniref:DUF4139 domain-containing protein n=1 Tax=uncultured Rhodospira sp. TaxID=1936189 RepID=UPI00263629BB|nr:DUF4139 domain-containing protein [uncultured Rhodospira sp.]
MIPRLSRRPGFASVLATALALTAVQVPAARAAEEIAVPPGGPGSVALTIHSGGGAATVHETRTADLPAGESVLAFPDVPAGADAASVRLVPADDGGGLTVLERALAADVPNRRRLLELSVGEEIGVLIHDQGEGQPPRRASATVLSVAEDVILRMDGAIRVGLPGDLVVDALPEGLRPTPTLLATVEAAAAGPRALSLGYLTGGLTWAADYGLDLEADGETAALSGWATLHNTSGRSFTDARLTLAAGQVEVAENAGMGALYEQAAMRGAAGAAIGAAMLPPPVAEAQGGLHFYPIERPVTLAHRQTLQVALVNAPDITVTPRSVVAAGNRAHFASPRLENDTVNARRHLILANTEEAGLGLPLPAGVVRVWQPGPDGLPRFLGADRVSHVAVGGEAELVLGADFDVTAERRRTAFRRIGEDVTESEHTVVLRNGKPDRAVTVDVEAALPGDWTILSESAPHEKETAKRVVWSIEVPAGGETTLTYAVRARF